MKCSQQTTLCEDLVGHVLLQTSVLQTRKLYFGMAGWNSVLYEIIRHNSLRAPPWKILHWHFPSPEGCEEQHSLVFTYPPFPHYSKLNTCRSFYTQGLISERFVYTGWIFLKCPFVMCNTGRLYSTNRSFLCECRRCQNRKNQEPRHYRVFVPQQLSRAVASETSSSQARPLRWCVGEQIQ